MSVVDEITRWFKAWALEHPSATPREYTFLEAEAARQAESAKHYTEYVQVCQRAILDAREAEQIMATSFWQSLEAFLDRHHQHVAEQALEHAKNWEDVLVLRGETHGLTLLRRQLAVLKKAGEQAEQTLAEITRDSRTHQQP